MSDDGDAGRTPQRVGPFWDAVAGRGPFPPVAVLLGWQLEAVDPEAGTIVVRFEGRPEFANPQGNIQGGMLAAMLDDTMGPALVATLRPDGFAPTLEMKVSFLEPARVGPLWGHGRVVKRGGTVSFVEADLVDADGRMVARSTATVRMISMPGA
ncbi:MAG TPA: PaaI family thioesterase [Aquihabitans sp.]|jgi:uncharacterized protein (TIGR00369 family)|nr:PaaI family thioesterase [Aquihabitans sp.]